VKFVEILENFSWAPAVYTREHILNILVNSWKFETWYLQWLTQKFELSFSFPTHPTRSALWCLVREALGSVWRVERLVVVDPVGIFLFLSLTCISACQRTCCLGYLLSLLNLCILFLNKHFFPYNESESIFVFVILPVLYKISTRDEVKSVDTTYLMFPGFPHSNRVRRIALVLSRGVLVISWLAELIDLIGFVLFYVWFTSDYHFSLRPSATCFYML